MAEAARLEGPITALPGAGPRTAARLAARGLAAVRDILLHLPRGYDDLRRVTAIADLPAVPQGQVVLVTGTVEKIRIFPRRLLDLTVRDVGGAATVRARWFRPPRGMQRSFAKGSAVTLAGPVRIAPQGDGVLELTQPSNLTAALAAAGPGAAGLGIRPRYAPVAGVGGRVLEKIIAAAVERCADLMPAATAEALRALHRPSNAVSGAELEALAAGRSPAHRRLALDELVVLQAGFAAERRRARALPAAACAGGEAAAAARAGVRAALPFALTAAQERAIDEIARDMAAPQPMQRLLVGDVGSGKTAVAFAAAALAAAGGGLSLLMAPTEVLADQHLVTLSAFAAQLPAPGLRVARLTAATPRAERQAILDACRDGRVGLLVGTQALLEARAALPNLTLAIVDEQHRFGVAQRAALRRAPATEGAGEGDAAARVPHLLVMSATPIPRTLALAVYGDLDATVLDQLPPGRRPPATAIFHGGGQREAAYRRLEQRLADGHQAFVVCPVREAAARPGAVTAVARHAQLRRALGARGFRVGLLHGGLDAARKESVLRSFAAGALDVLVATTVVELGIDVPNATVMLIEDADRFGLAQLHQLRGRVGRGARAGECLLCTGGGVGDAHADADEGDGEGGEGSTSRDALARLRQLAETTDGFRIAEADLARRGAGDLFGARQAGASALRFVEPGAGGLAAMFELVALARAEAERIIAADPDLALPQHGALRAAVAARWARGAVFAEEAG